MKNFPHALAFGFVLLLCSVFAHGQSIAPFTLTGTGCSKPISVTDRATATYQVTGSWSGTIQPQVSINGQPPVNAQATPAASTTKQSTIIANGAYFTTVSPYSSFVLCGATVTGTATIYLNLSTQGH